MKNLNETRGKYAKQIVGLNLSLIFISILYYILGGFDLKEFSALIAVLGSVSAIYLGALFQFLGKKIKAEKEELNTSIEKNQSFYTSTSSTEIGTSDSSPRPNTTASKWKAFDLLRWIIPAHFLLLFGIITLKAFTQINAQEMNIFLTLVEGAFGGYMGYLVNAIFKVA